eukprot:5079821-Prymnesium_polylepis.1
MQPCAWRHVAKVGPIGFGMDPGSCMRRCTSVLRLNRPEPATIYGGETERLRPKSPNPRTYFGLRGTAVRAVG